MMKKVSTSVSLSIKTVVRMDEYMDKHGGTFSGFLDIAANYYLDHNPDVSIVNIIDDKLIESIKDIPEDTEPPPTDNTPVANKNAFNFDDLDLDR
jgi:hypothetical protein